ncbi:MAG TPA: hypothetical protein VFU31_11955 [Candidatus Binatia bacterium]|nr:hypothetical protein [Candidatus Binatia bacterium]
MKTSVKELSIAFVINFAAGGSLLMGDGLRRRDAALSLTLSR